MFKKNSTKGHLFSPEDEKAFDKTLRKLRGSDTDDDDDEFQRFKNLLHEQVKNARARNVSPSSEETETPISAKNKPR